METTPKQDRSTIYWWLVTLVAAGIWGHTQPGTVMGVLCLIMFYLGGGFTLALGIAFGLPKFMRWLQGG